MPKKRKTTRRRRKTYRRNPSPRRRTRARRAVRRYASKAGGILKGMNIKSALTNSMPLVVGMFAAKFAAKRFGDMNATEADPETWGWSSYLKGAAGAVVAGFIGQSVKPGSGQKILEGGLALMIYKLAQNKLIQPSETMSKWFGAEDEDEDYVPSEYLGYGQEDEYTDETGTYMLGQGGAWMPADERHRLPEYSGMGDQLVTPGRLGDDLTPPGRLGDAYSSAWGIK